MSNEGIIHKMCIGVDIGGSHISCLGVDLDERSVILDTLSRVSVDHDEAAEVIFNAWASAISATLQLVDQTVAGIGIAIPGPFNYRQGVSRMEHKFRSLKGIDIPLHLTRHLNTPGLKIRFLNDAVAFAVGEAWIGAGKEASRIVAITLGTGFGSAYAEDGIPVISRSDVAPEGCFWHLPYRDGIADEYFSTRWFTRRYAEETGVNVSGVKEIADRSDRDQRAQRMFEEFGDNLGGFLVPWLKKFDADLLIIGGNIAHSLPLFEQSMKSKFTLGGLDIEVKLSELMEHAAMVGAARLFDPLFWDNYKDADQPL